AEDGIRDFHVTGVQTCALPICARLKRINKKAPHWLPRRGFLPITESSDFDYRNAGSSFLVELDLVEVHVAIHLAGHAVQVGGIATVYINARQAAEDLCKCRTLG